MNILDLLILAVCIFCAYLFMQKRKKKKTENNPEASSGLTNYNALRGIQSENAPLHGVSIVSLYYDSAASYANMEKDGMNTSFDLNCETKVNNVLNSLKADGYTPALNALSCVDRVIFYITY